MNLSFKDYQLTFEYPFGISSYTRTTHDVVLVNIEYLGEIGTGEASMAKYLGETKDSVKRFLSKVKLAQFKAPLNILSIHEYIDNIAPGNTAAKTAIDIALHDLKGKIEQKPCYQFYNVNPAQMPVTSLTLGIDELEVIRKKVKGAGAFKAIKVKLGSAYDKEIIKTIREETTAPLYIDANQGWKDKKEALDMIFWLKEQGTVFIEQPMDREDYDSNGWLTAHSPLPIIADEAMQRLSDLEKLKDLYTGINIKLMKCTGMYEAHQIISRARELGLKIMVGCMSETSCAIMAAASLAPLCDWADLDSPWLINNNPFKNPILEDGKIKLTDSYGLGLEKL